MNFETSENLKMIAETARDFAEKNIRPHIMDWDESQHFPKDLFHQLGEMGFMGIVIPEKYGGSGLSYHEYVAIVDEISQVDPSIGLSVAAHNSLCTNHIYEFANEEQRMKWLPQLATGKVIGAWGLTEHNTGSDAGGMSTTAVRDGNDWIINGAKNFITHAISGDIAVVMTRTGEKGAPNNATAFVLEKGMSGFTSGKKENKLGMRASETAELIFDNVRVPDSHRLGEVGEGFKQALKILDGGRISIAALSLGIAKGAYKAALKYAKERKQFGQAIADFQAINFKLADMVTEIDASELLIQRAAYLKNNKMKMTREGAMAKLYASEACVKIANEAVQIFGGYGYTKDFPAEKYYRDSKLCTIGEGTSEIQKLVIGRDITK
ncbi:acyl-CoA dehydrogenase family protein [Elizabethkingia meningoseptica]|uniref:acyl-CoA dehydrogenase family protein n=1 Tax=Elizabethkingia meningoseptica TaxID=238 RepID=UPI000999C0EE|nr:acyl-CoA dehydrogenase family protein [Elizabethkingia meningoseptica]MCL1676189.1 acyl-CoA dehydrogenase family protein [Elizabethkingia meningoseptica]MCL1684898.1 acyl-CoA dehydrogenase family protein [Elizabethkingia meningoseptica]MDE5489721.1 acyl-CoA dehydrogenase family protein [Elizabethkingia meningoseptica]MEC4712762.1 acyl-CoA dehydrogenase family protein [Elizabethkingia meningoseptica]MVW91412.1 acyl-CoA dehydrogenase [Elizabethkingia meningoseptica]